jgi:dTDP-4-dehydrorhamnose 3,5-epimerase
VIFEEIGLPGAFVISTQPIEDNRGSFTRIWCDDEFKRMGISTQIVQSSLSYNARAGTIRGMHYQSPYEEEKIVMVTRGAVYDVIVDLRPESKTYKHWAAVELSERNLKAIYIPKFFAHGFQTLEDNTQVLYQISTHYKQEHAKGIRWNDPGLNISWPLPPSTISAKDESYPNYG